MFNFVHRRTIGATFLGNPGLIQTSTDAAPAIRVIFPLSNPNTFEIIS